MGLVKCFNSTKTKKETKKKYYKNQSIYLSIDLRGVTINLEKERKKKKRHGRI